VSQYIANACDFHPRNIGMPGFQLSGEVATRFRYDLEAALDKPLLLPVGFEGLEGHVMEQRANALASLDHVAEARSERTGGH
jgi:hypothetical protein